MSTFIDQIIGDRWLWAVAQSTLVAIATWLICLVAWRGEPGARARLALVGLICMSLAPLSLFIGLNDWSWGRFLPSQPSGLVGPASVETPASPTADGVPETIAVKELSLWQKLLVSSGNLFEEPVLATPQVGTIPAANQQASSTWSLTAIGLALLILGVAYGAVRLLVGWWQVSILRRTARMLDDPALEELLDGLARDLNIKEGIPIAISKRIGTAAIIGWRRPLLLLPVGWDSWSEDERRAVIAHELSHIRRSDYLTTALAQCAVALNFFHPLAHVLVGRLRLDQELAADALAAPLVGGQQRYVRILAGLALRQSSVGVPGPAQAFLPPRRMFVRRLEMLRNWNTPHRGWSRVLTGMGLATIFSVAVLATGLRPRLVTAAQPIMPAGAPVAQSSSLKELIDLVPPSLIEGVVVVDVPAVLASPGVAPLVKQIPNMEVPVGRLKINIGKVQQVVFAVPSVGSPIILMRMQEGGSLDADELTEVRKLDDRTYVMGGNEELRGTVGVFPAEMRWKKLLEPYADGAVRAAMRTDVVREIVLREAGADHPILAFAPLWEEVDTVAMGIALDDEPRLDAILATDNPENVAATLSALKVLAGNYLANAPKAMQKQNGRMDASQIIMMNAAVMKAKQILDSLKVEAVDSGVNVEVHLSKDDYAMVAMLAPAITSARQAAQRAQGMNNMKQLMLAFHNYHDVYGHLPPAVVRDPESGVERSWRVEILPFLEGPALYDQYRKDEPWDSEANLKVLNQMPRVFALPGEEGTTETPYQAFAGERMALSLSKNGKEPQFRDFTDGTSNTLTLVEMGTKVPWTKPVDVTDPDAPMNAMFRPEGVILVGVMDGSVKAIAKSIDPAIWKALLTRDGGEAVNQY